MKLHRRSPLPVFSNCMEGGVYSFVIFLLGCYFVTFKVLSLTIKIQFLYLVGCYFVTFKVLYEIPTFTGSVGATPGAR